MELMLDICFYAIYLHWSKIYIIILLNIWSSLFKPIDECENEEGARSLEDRSIRTMSDLREFIGKDSYCNVGYDEGLKCFCGDVECVIEMELYRYIGQREKFEET